MRSGLLGASVAAISSLVFAVPIAADPIVIRAGGVGFDTGDPPGLHLSGDGFSVTSLFPSIASFQLCTSGCFPGEVISPSTVFGSPAFNFGLGTGFATVNGTTYGTAIAGPNSIVFRGTLSFDASPVMIPMPGAGDSVRLTSPFVMSGSIAGFETSAATTPLFAVDVAGTGVGTLVLERRLDDPTGALVFRAVQYDIADPVPEPTTILLCGAGLTGLFVRRRRALQQRRRELRPRQTLP
jgi:hypothetical protein